MPALRVGPTLTVPASAMEVSFSRSSGPGGQHVQRTDTRVRLRIRLRECPGLRPGAIARLRARHPSLLTAEDEELTPTMKLKRSFVSEKYDNLISEMYSR